MIKTRVSFNEIEVHKVFPTCGCNFHGLKGCQQQAREPYYEFPGRENNYIPLKELLKESAEELFNTSKTYKEETYTTTYGYRITARKIRLPKILRY